MRPLYNVLLKIAPVKWQRVVEDPWMIKGILQKVLLIITDGLTKELCIGAHLFTKQVIRLGRKDGYIVLCI